MDDKNPLNFDPNLSHPDIIEEGQLLGTMDFSPSEDYEELHRLDPLALHAWKVEHENHRAELIMRLAKNIRNKNLSDEDKRSLRRLEMYILDGDLPSFELAVKEVSEDRRAALLAEVAQDMAPIGYVIEHRLDSGAQDGFVVSVRRGDKGIEVNCAPQTDEEAASESTSGASETRIVFEKMADAGIIEHFSAAAST